MTRLTPALTRSFDLLELLLASDVGLTSGQLISATGLPRTTVHELLNTMVARGYVARHDLSGLFVLGPMLFRLGLRVEGRFELKEVGQRYCERMSEHCEETVSFATLDGTQVVFLARAETTHVVRLTARVGGALPAHCTAPGKALLAFHHREFDLITSSSMVASTRRSITDAGQLADEMARIRERGFAVDLGEAHDNVVAVASPVFDRHGEAVGALSIAIPDIRWGNRELDDWAAIVVDAAARMTVEIGGRVPFAVAPAERELGER
jgi:IclR family transcriptional regulator, KDG regulon repressor